jgi:hypothetical protein
LNEPIHLHFSFFFSCFFFLQFLLTLDFRNCVAIFSHIVSQAALENATRATTADVDRLKDTAALFAPLLRQNGGGGDNDDNDDDDDNDNSHEDNDIGDGGIGGDDDDAGSSSGGGGMSVSTATPLPLPPPPPTFLEEVEVAAEVEILEWLGFDLMVRFKKRGWYYSVENEIGFYWKKKKCSHGKNRVCPHWKL